MDKKHPKPNKKDRKWQNDIAKNVQKENVKLGHTQGKEQFDKVVGKIFKKK